ncbi:AAA family ATPase [Nocardia carnea]|uniref:AAA family ATPase n=1 Tax=Nocardia carnea TaxID=37328 RepID=A0ABW7TL47_9NOCA
MINPQKYLEKSATYAYHGRHNSDLIRRNATRLAHETLADAPITVISGARQVGKTTLMHQLVRDHDARVVASTTP